MLFVGGFELANVGKKRRREKKVPEVITPSNLCFSSGLGLGIFYLPKKKGLGVFCNFADNLGFWDLGF